MGCGAATPLGTALRGRLWAATPAPATAPARTPSAASGSLRAATVAFALVLGTGAWAGARMTAPPTATAGGPVVVAGAAVPAPAAPVPVPGPAAAGAIGQQDQDPVPAAAGTPDLPAVDAPALAGEPATVVEPAPAAGLDDTTGDAPSDAPTAAPELDHVVVVALPPLAYDAFVDPAAGAPYLAGTLVPEGVLLRGFHGAAPRAAASNVALLSGQAPNAATLAGCASDGDVLPGTLGDDEQATGSGCRYPADVFTLADLLGSTDRDWRLLADGGAACTAGADGADATGRAAPLRFRSLTDVPGCAGRIAATDRLPQMLEDRKQATALTWLELACPASGPCDAAAVDAELRRVLGPVAMRLPARSAVLLLPAHAPGDDRSACCDQRPWMAGSGGGGRTGALVLSPAAAGGTVLDEPVDHYDAHRTVAQLLGVRPLGLAARAEVTGLPPAIWRAGNGATGGG